MSEVKHTPGPWYWSGHSLMASRKDHSETITVTQDWPFTPKVEDARLIAAAPDLLDALRSLFNSYKELADSGDAGFWSLEDCPEGKTAMAAISKAEGK